MRIVVTPSEYEKRIFNVVIDFTGYIDAENKYFKVWCKGKWNERQELEVSDRVLDSILATVKFRRIRMWHSKYTYPKRCNLYQTTVISDREL